LDRHVEEINAGDYDEEKLERLLPICLATLTEYSDNSDAVLANELKEHIKRLEKTIEEHEQRNQARASTSTEARRRAEAVECRLDAQQNQNEEEARRVYAWLKEHSSGDEEPGEECAPSNTP
jgi:hypothetical protein